jgi:hypothetical protein
VGIPRRWAASDLQEFIDSDDVAAAGAGTAWPQPPAESIAYEATVLAEVARRAPGAFIDDMFADWLGQAGSASSRARLLMAATTPAPFFIEPNFPNALAVHRLDSISTLWLPLLWGQHPIGLPGFGSAGHYELRF